MSSYDNWQDALEREFFDPQQSDHAVVLYVDDAAESTLMHRYGLLYELADAVADELDWGSTKGLFGPVWRRCERWAAGEQQEAPPSLPVLAASVVAASKMAADPDVSPMNYYTRLAEVFGTGADGRHKLVESFPAVVSMWQQLHQWLEGQGGRIGRSTISTDPHWNRIGYPLSQALLRESDRRVLTSFFAASGVKAGRPDEFPGREVIRLLQLWTARSSHGLSHGFHAELHHPRLGIGEGEGGREPVVAVLLERLVEHWDGTLYEPKHRKAASLRLVLADRGRRLEWAADTLDGVTTAVVRSGKGEELKLCDPYGGLYAGLEMLPVSAYQLARGLDLEGDTVVLHWQARDIIFFAEDEYRGDYVSVSVFSPGEPHWMLVADGALAAVRQTLKQISDKRVWEVKGPLAGWTLFKNVDLSEEATAGSLLAGKSEGAAHFVPAARRGVRLVNGLKIAAAKYGRDHYLLGGEPDLLLPRDLSALEQYLTVQLDGRKQNFPAKAVLKPFPLKACQLETGPHKVGTDGHDVTFTVSAGIRERQAPEAGQYGHRCDGVSARVEAETLAAEASAIRGADAPASVKLPQTILLPRKAQEVLLLGAQGEVENVHPPEVPEWARRLPPDVLGYKCEIEVPDGFVWALVRMQKAVNVHRLDPVMAVPLPFPRPDDQYWAEAVLSGASCSDSSWPAYVEAARSIGS